jgi:hypothetical protein
MEARTVDYGGIGWAVNHLRLGHRMRRRGWNGRDMWIAFVPDGSTQIPQKYADGLPVNSVLVMKGVDGHLAAWLCSQTDLLASDWEMAFPVQPGVTKFSEPYAAPAPFDITPPATIEPSKA